MIYAPNVANEPSIRFFKKFPKLGAYQVGCLSTASVSFVLCVVCDCVCVHVKNTWLCKYVCVCNSEHASKAQVGSRGDKIRSKGACS
jgi:hypothetical protein